MQTTFTPENFEKAYKPYRLNWGIAYLNFPMPNVYHYSFCYHTKVAIFTVVYFLNDGHGCDI